MAGSRSISTAVVFSLALNLRPAVTSLGSALADVSVARNLTAAVLVALPLWAIGLGGWATPWVHSRLGTHRTVTLSLATLGVSLVVRVLGGQVLLVAGTALACLAIALLGTLLPLLAKGFSRAYTAALGIGSTAGALVTPAVVTSASWQAGLAVWAFVALLAQQVWSRTHASVVPPTVSRSSRSWALMVHFGLLSAVTFLVMGWFPAILRGAGVPASYAGACLALSMAMGLPMMWLVPGWTLRWRNQTLLVVILATPNIAGVTGLLVAPGLAPWLWATLTGLGMGSLAFALTTIGMRSTDTGLSALVQGYGYLLAGVCVLACGWLHWQTGTWRAPLVLALAVLLGQIVSGYRAVHDCSAGDRIVRAGRLGDRAGADHGGLGCARPGHAPG
ncbi:MFS transporter [Actinocrispum sp. NPDC049592]|uniref:MFS transporter n=1 Tax=Actinocrispum sp. NPDC049592 TaxID=3154835 RepID=UPI0034163DEF